jgi:hypothetical protein
MPEPTPVPSRRFNDKEVARIIKRASELQEEEAPTDSTTGLSLAELEQVAKEAGLDPALVRRAAADLDTRVTDQQPSMLVGAPTTLRLERTIDGEVPADEYEAIVAEIQRTLDAVGTGATLGRSLSWTLSPASRRRSARSVQVTITPRGGRTTIRIEEHMGALAGGIFGGAAGIGGGFTGPAIGVGMGALHSGVAAVGMVGVVVSGVYLLARTIYGRVTRRRGEQLQALMSRLAAHVATTAVTVRLPPPPA